ncbi:MFS transporter, partial [Gluconobacter oxydans]|uniref:MFS transporter n=1 Tax=Gluconobacter oxydans TaxID=442 RepID=UPI0039EA2E24
MTLKRTALRESLRPWFALVGLVVPVNLMMALDKNSFALAAPRIGQSLGLDYVHVSLVIAALSWSYAIMQLPSGWLVHRLGPRRSLGGRLSALVPDDRNHAGIRLATLSVRVRLSWRHPERRVAASFPRRSVSAPGRVTLTVSRYARPAPIGWIGGLLGHRGGDRCMLAVQSFYHVTLPQYLLSAR